MIGVLAEEDERWAVAEFFQLFKTPWEWYREGHLYDVLLSTRDLGREAHCAPIVLIYSGNILECDKLYPIECISMPAAHGRLSFHGDPLPVYRGHLAFLAASGSFLVDKESTLPAMYFDPSSVSQKIRVGYNLFAEVKTLLTVGQPVDNAHIPTLDRHIALLRSLILVNGGMVEEIPPVPLGHRFIACLTHDVDHPLLRNHGLDHTTLGFFYRATIGSFLEVIRGRRGVFHLLRNLKAAAKLPFVHLGMDGDFWSDFVRYRELEGGARSSFFVIPFQGRAGRTETGYAPARRASGYGAKEIAAQIQTLMSSGCEIGLHGINAWLDSSEARAELEEIRSIAGHQKLGVRMHWLYFNEHSPIHLDLAGAAYDSTVGYNETVGYRAGTSQAYRPQGAMELLELPLHIMDTALFYPSHLHLTPRQAMERMREIVEHAAHAGGCVTINWHDRSIAPERYWDQVYVELLQLLKEKGAWFATAEEAVNWFKKRRSMVFDGNSWVSTASESPEEHPLLPVLTRRVLKGGVLENTVCLG